MLGIENSGDVVKVIDNKVDDVVNKIDDINGAKKVDNSTINDLKKGNKSVEVIVDGNKTYEQARNKAFDLIGEIGETKPYTGTLEKRTTSDGRQGEAREGKNVQTLYPPSYL